ncbi:MAG: hypothetical protein JSS27_20825 [Planctomycetes bacterium]|nr:hypothetical protein [Planctomycetota bacterium]
METAGVWQISLADLEVAVRTADPAALLVPGRILRRVIKQDRQIPGVGLRVPHRKTYLVARDRLLSMAYPDELGLNATSELPEQVILLARPEAEKLNAMTRGRALVKYWRLLMHARVHMALEARRAEGQLTPADVWQRFEQLGDTVVAEIRDVLEHDEWLLPPADDETLYLEFAAVFFELRFFAPRLLPDYFPSIADFDAVASLLGRDVDAAALFERTRLHGAPHPEEFFVVDDEEPHAAQHDEHLTVPPRKQSERAYCRLMEHADRARARGNLVRSAMQRTQAAGVIGPKAAKAARREGRADLDQLARRLQVALDMSEDDYERWATSLIELLPHAAEGLRSPEARILNDVQKVCVDHERGVYTIDLVEWVTSRGKQPLRRPLPCLREVSIAKHLHAAAAKLGAARLSVDARHRLSHLFEATQAAAETKLRGTLRPRIEKAFNVVELRPGNVPETVARQKLIEELLDRIADHGYLTLGDLRDAISRNNLKIRDLSDWREAWGNDQLLQLDRRLADSLDGVYRRGELYRRIPQGLSALAFGTPRGRHFTRYVMVPFGGAFLVLEFLHHLVHKIFGERGAQEAIPVSALSARLGDIASLSVQILILGSFFLGLLYSDRFRQRVVDICQTSWQLLRLLTVTWPRRLLDLPAVRAVLASPIFQWCRRLALKPLLFTLALLAVRWLFVRTEASWTTRVVAFVGFNLLLNSRIGRNVDEMVTDWAVRGWHQLRMRVLAAAFQFVVDIFGQLLSALEQVLYAVDEWLRFRRGEPRAAMLFKAVFGTLWGFVTFFIRFCVTLLIEPQVNPIKHFPVVTVSHKIMLPFIPTLAGMLEQHFGIGTQEAAWYASLIILGIPGIFGFLVWELKENWRIFAANRSPQLDPVMIGSHGETMSRLLRPGFHSGTLFRLYNRLRRVDRKAYIVGNWAPPRKLHDRLHHVALEVRHFAEREFVALLDQTELWTRGDWRVGPICIGLRHVDVPIERRDMGDPDAVANEPLWLRFEDRAGWLLATIRAPAWVANLSTTQAQTLATALAGMLKLAGVQVLRNVIDDVCREQPGRFAVDENGLTLLGREGDRAWYDVNQANGQPCPPTVASDGARWGSLDWRRLRCGEIAISWNGWVDAWQRVREEPIAPPLDEPTSLLGCSAEVSPAAKF